MFFSFKKKHNLVKSGILKGMTDIHSHILPGVDDGSPDRATSLELLQFLENLGITSVWLTPHVMSDMQRNTTAYLTERFEAFRNYYKGPIRLHQAGEYMMDAQFTSKLPAEVLPLGKNHLLVETSYMLPPVGMKEILASVKQNGYFPVIAHPERYTYMDMDDYRLLRSRCTPCGRKHSCGRHVQLCRKRFTPPGAICFHVGKYETHQRAAGCPQHTDSKQ